MMNPVVYLEFILCKFTGRRELYFLGKRICIGRYQVFCIISCNFEQYYFYINLSEICFIQFGMLAVILITVNLTTSGFSSADRKVGLVGELF